MKIRSQDIQPMLASTLLKSAVKKGKSIFLLSLPGNFFIFVFFITILLLLFNYVYSIGADGKILNTLRLLNNAFIISLSSVNVFYLLVDNDEQRYLQQVKEALLKTLKVIPVLIVATVFYAIFVTMGLSLLLLPGLILYAYLGVYSQTIAFENKGFISSLLRSRELVNGSFWKVFSILLVLLIISNIIVFGSELILITYLSVYPFWLEVVVYSLLYMLMMPFIASLYSLLYFDLRSRQEAFDFSVFNKEKNTLAS